MSVETVLHAFLSQETPESRERLLAFLPKTSLDRLKKLPPFHKPITLKKLEEEDLLKKVHWSWFLPTLKSYSLEEQALFLAALDRTAATHLSNELPCKLSKEPLTSLGIAYLRQLLLTSLIGSHNRLIPKHLLPPSSLNRLLSLSKKQLIVLIDFLSLYDLAGEIRQIVETKILKNIYSCLTEQERIFLKTISLKTDVYTLPKIGLDRWDGNCETLRHFLHRKGLNRLGLALSAQDPSLIWYLCHQLDIGRGTALFKYCVKEGSESMIQAAVQQVEELLKHE